ncbi:SDR family NAD(P)-dependent oxidoreductase [Fredinandcohnia onubensis]|uniref:SDR family NAD(P)-dependent oxidoreductase n=1 Tax=Fredinandcohnia onubensis TaxID=1571209 RepID=UPI000C0BCBAC|nr:SDR family oxidoreductase [Fredinandcohnia onubensis]
MKFTDKVVIITGGSQGIGKDIVLNFCKEGAKVAVFDTDEENGMKLVKQIHNQDGKISFYKVDVSDHEQVTDTVTEVVTYWGTIDILVNNAAITNPQTTEDIPVQDWKRIVDVNLNGVFVCSQVVSKQMKKKGSGKIVNISSVAGKRIGFASGSAYTASKAGVIGFTRHLAYELAPFGINVNSVCPGGTLTSLYESITDEQTLEKRVKSIPYGRLCTPQDISNAVLFLASPEADMICGVSLDVDGGSMLGWYNIQDYYANRKRIGEKI